MKLPLPAAPALKTLLLIAAVTTSAMPDCSHASVQAPIDPQASAETRRLHAHLARLADLDGFAFGNQGDRHSGVGWVDTADNAGNVPESDIFKITGANAGVSGYNVDWLFDADGQPRRDAIRIVGEEVRAAYARGEIITFHWPMTNPETGIDDRNCDGCSHLINTVLSPNLQGRTGRHYATWQGWMDTFADFLRDEAYYNDGRVRKPIPVLFRPWHEMNQGEDGKGRWYQVVNNSTAEYRALWQQTVRYLRDTRRVHQLLYVYAPSLNGLACDGCEPHQAYSANYPGDEWVDVMAGDGYFAGSDDATRLHNLLQGVSVIVDTAIAHGKISALSETGFKGGLQDDPHGRFWFGQWLTALRTLPATSRLSYVMTWTNGGDRVEPKAYVPIPGSREAADFRQFRDAPETLFADDLLRLFNGAP